MSEENIVNECKKYIQAGAVIEYVGEDNDGNIRAMTSGTGAIEGLLSLYQQEKEKNKNAKDRIEYYILDNISIENNPTEVHREFEKIYKLLEG
jgi:hypothetical protein